VRRLCSDPGLPSVPSDPDDLRPEEPQGVHGFQRDGVGHRLVDCGCLRSCVDDDRRACSGEVDFFDLDGFEALVLVARNTLVFFRNFVVFRVSMGGCLDPCFGISCSKRSRREGVIRVRSSRF
jgi:hypothetical protein